MIAWFSPHRSSGTSTLASATTAAADPWAFLFESLPSPAALVLPRPFKPGTMPVPLNLAAHEQPRVERVERVASSPPAPRPWASSLRAFRRMPRRLSRVAAW